jgi:hypothetical protein
MVTLMEMNLPVDRKRPRAAFFCLLVLILIVHWPVIVSGGNKELVDKRVQEMDELNRQAVGQLPEIPQNGQIELETDVQYRNGSVLFNVYRQKTTVSPEGTEALPIPEAAPLKAKGASGEAPAESAE